MNGFTLRKAKLIIFSTRLWRKRLVFWCGAIAVGIFATYFAVLCDMVRDLFIYVVGLSPYLPLVTSPLLFALTVWLTRRFFPGTAGSGIPQAIAARILRSSNHRRFLLGAHLIPAKIVLTLLGFLAGASIGREGPTVQVGASLMLLTANSTHISKQRGVVLAGAAAGVAAAFNTPLAGIVFAIEEMARAFEQRNSAIILTAIVLAGASSISILGNYNYFGVADVQLLITRDWFPILSVGVIGGLFGSLFARIIIDGNRALRKRFANRPFRYELYFALICGLLIALLGLATNGATYGTGYKMANALLHGEMTGQWWQPLAKFAATAISTLSGIPGGIFSPSLSVGAAMGAGIDSWFPGTPQQGIILLGMVAYFAAVTQAPITAFVIVLEITGKVPSAIPLIAAAVVAAGVSRMICPVSLYHSMAKQFVMLAKQASDGTKPS